MIRRLLFILAAAVVVTTAQTVVQDRAQRAAWRRFELRRQLWL